LVGAGLCGYICGREFNDHLRGNARVLKKARKHEKIRKVEGNKKKQGPRPKKREPFSQKNKAQLRSDIIEIRKVDS